MKNTKKAFTLVELIVVITILAILGTIAFISLQGYSADARNSKRTSDLNSLASKMNIQITEGTSVMSFVSGTSASLTGASIAGTWTTTSDYAAGIPNYLVLGVKSSDFQDPSGDDYKLGLTFKKSGEYELAASRENGSGEREGQIIGTYNPRAVDVVTADSVTSTKVTLADADLNKFLKGDYIVSGGWTGALVTKVSSDLSTLTVNADLTATAGGETVALLAAESAGLIADKDEASTAVVNGLTTTLPY